MKAALWSLYWSHKCTQRIQGWTVTQMDRLIQNYLKTFILHGGGGGGGWLEIKNEEDLVQTVSGSKSNELNRVQSLFIQYSLWVTEDKLWLPMSTQGCHVKICSLILQVILIYLLSKRCQLFNKAVCSKINGNQLLVRKLVLIRKNSRTQHDVIPSFSCFVFTFNEYFFSMFDKIVWWCFE